MPADGTYLKSTSRDFGTPPFGYVSVTSPGYAGKANGSP
jgi:hypothetical protein